MSLGSGRCSLLVAILGTNKISCDCEFKGGAVWDVSSLTWGSVFSPNLPDYQVPQVLLSVRAGSVNGDATKKDPAEGWTDQDLKTVFTTPRRVTAPPNNMKNRNSTLPAPLKSSHTGAIAGVVAGGIAALVPLTSLILLLRRRNLKTRGLHELQAILLPSIANSATRGLVSNSPP